MLTTDRRSLFAGTAAAAVAVAIPASAANAASDIEVAWQQWAEARKTYNALPDPDDADNAKADAIEAEETRLWAVMDRAEEAIRGGRARSPRDTASQLWIALAHSIDTQGQDNAITDRDLFAILASEHTLDWNGRLIVAALRSLEAMA